MKKYSAAFKAHVDIVGMDVYVILGSAGVRVSFFNQLNT
jgi:hypothetical protein